MVFTGRKLKKMRKSKAQKKTAAVIVVTALVTALIIVLLWGVFHRVSDSYAATSVNSIADEIRLTTYHDINDCDMSMFISPDSGRIVDFGMDEIDTVCDRNHLDLSENKKAYIKKALADNIRGIYEGGYVETTDNDSTDITDLSKAYIANAVSDAVVKVDPTIDKKDRVDSGTVVFESLVDLNDAMQSYKNSNEQILKNASDIAEIADALGIDIGAKDNSKYLKNLLKAQETKIEGNTITQGDRTDGKNGKDGSNGSGSNGSNGKSSSGSNGSNGSNGLNGKTGIVTKTLKADLSDAQKTQLESISSLKSEVDSLSKTIQSLQSSVTKVDNNTKAIESVNNEVNNTKKSIETVNNNITKISSDVSDLQSKYTSLDGRVTALEKSLKDNSDKYNDTSKKMQDSIDKNKSETDSKIDKNKSETDKQIETIKTEFTEKTQTIEKLITDNKTEIDKIVSDTKTEINQAVEQLKTDLNVKIDNNTNLINDIKKAMEDSNTKIYELINQNQENVKSNKEAIEANKELIEKYKAEIDKTIEDEKNSLLEQHNKDVESINNAHTEVIKVNSVIISSGSTQGTITDKALRTGCVGVQVNYVNSGYGIIPTYSVDSNSSDGTLTITLKEAANEDIEVKSVVVFRKVEKAADTDSTPAADDTSAAGTTGDGTSENP